MQKLVSKLACLLAPILMVNVAVASGHHHHSHHHSARHHHHNIHTSSLQFSDYSVNPESHAPYYRDYRDSALTSERIQRGVASWYGPGFHHHYAANGKRYNMFAISAASKTLPLNSYAKVTVLRTGRQITVKITDRGPFVSGRVIDLSFKAAKSLGIVNLGESPVEIYLLP